MADLNRLELVVNNLAGTLCTVRAEPSWSGVDVKAAIEERAGVSRQQQRLLAGLAELRDLDTLDRLPPGRTELTLLLRPAEQVAWLDLVDRDWTELLHAPAAAWEDPEVVARAVSQSGWALQRAAPELRAERSVVLAAVRQNGLALQHAAPELRAEWEVVLAAVTQCGRALEFAAAALKQDRTFVLEAVACNGRALEHAGQEMRADRQVVLAAVEHCGCALVGASGQLRADFEVVVAACLRDPGALVFASGALRADTELQALLHRRAPGYDIASEAEGDEPVTPHAKDITKYGTWSFGDGTSDGHSGMSRVLGKQGAALCELANLGLPVVPGFCVTAQRQDSGAAPSAATDGLVKAALAKLEQATAHYLGSLVAPLTLSITADALMDSHDARLTNVGLNDAIVEAMAAREHPRLAWDSYRRLILNFSKMVKELDMEPFTREFDRVKQMLDEKCTLGTVHDESSIPTAELKTLVRTYKALYEEQVGEPFPQDPNAQVSVALRTLMQAPGTGDKLGERPQSAAAIVQAMTFGNVGSQSGVGLATAKFESKHVAGLRGEWLPSAQHEDVSELERAPLRLTLDASRTWAAEAGIEEHARALRHPSLEEQMPGVYAKLVHCVDVMSTQMTGVRSFEFTVQEGKFWVQCPGKAKWKASKTRRERKMSLESATATVANSDFCDSQPLQPEFCAAVPGSPSETSTTAFPSEASQEMPETFSRSTSGATVSAEVSQLAWPLHQGSAASAVHFHCHRRALASHANLLKAAQRRRSKKLASQAAAQAVVSEPGVTASTVAEDVELSALRLPVWQTALAGGAAGVASQLAMRRAAGSLRAAPTGALCCSFYVNLLHAASTEGDMDGVAAPARLLCAATAATAAVSCTHSAGVLGAACATGSSLAGVSRSALLGGLGGALARAVPAMAMEMCAIDVAKQQFANRGYDASPGVLLACGGISGILSQSVLCPLAMLATKGSDALAGGPSNAARPLLRELAAGCRRSVPAAAANSLVRVGLVTQFLKDA